MKKRYLNHFWILLIILAPIQVLAQDDILQADESTTNERDSYTKRGSVGSFGEQLSQNPTLININGYVTNEFFKSQTGATYFDNHYFNTFINVQLSDKIIAEVQMEYEHGGRDITARYAMLDYRVSDAFIIRSGKFLVPAGDFNEYLYPEFITKTISRPYANREIVPVSWGEVGVQIRGKFDAGSYGSTLTPFYAVYVVNGLQGDPGDGIRSLRGNSHSGNNDNLAYGANLGAEIGNAFSISTHVYNGKYSEDEALSILIAGASVAYDNDAFSFYGEYMLANQENYEADGITVFELNKSGYYAQLAYKFNEKIEPLVRYDAIKLDGAPEADRTRITLGLNYYLQRNAVLKVNYELRSDDGIDADDNLLGVQLSVGF